MTQEIIKLRVSEDDQDVAYVTLPGHPGEGTKSAIAKQVRLSTLLSYTGADIYLDLDVDGKLIGIEILA